MAEILGRTEVDLGHGLRLVSRIETISSQLTLLTAYAFPFLFMLVVQSQMTRALKDLSRGLQEFFKKIIDTVTSDFILASILK
jgi:hypothetical protein